MTENIEKKKMAAALAAVNAYLIQEQEAAMRGPEPERAAAVSAVPQGLWSISGRMTLMQNRQLMQMRTFKN